MNRKKQERLRRAGWKVGSVAEVLGLTPEEAIYVELKGVLADGLRGRRQGRRLTQAELAKLLESSQSRVAKMEAGDSTVSLDLLVRSLLALGTTVPELARMIRRAA